MLQFHAENQALATLAVQDRKTSRYCSSTSTANSADRKSGNLEPELVRLANPTQPRAFSGIHFISPRLLKLMTEDGAFSIITTYLRLAAQGEKIKAFPADKYYWRDLGKPENITQAAQDFKEGWSSLSRSPGILPHHQSVGSASPPDTLNISTLFSKRPADHIAAHRQHAGNHQSIRSQPALPERLFHHF